MGAINAKAISFRWIGFIINCYIGYMVGKMNNCDEKYLSYNPKDVVDGGARIPYSERDRCWIAPKAKKINRIIGE